mmetsp:Transcript_4275/g.12075  ORF Transcript_4275/g.12075 Transcript_4275/m.12075 type:complete len:301 (-) Transcript_4275:682-1584(-)
MRRVELGAVLADCGRDGEIVRALPREAAAGEHHASGDAVDNVGGVGDNAHGGHDEGIVAVHEEGEELVIANLGHLAHAHRQACADGVWNARPAEGVQTDDEHDARERAHGHEVEQRVGHCHAEHHANRGHHTRDARGAAADHIHLGQADGRVAAHAAHKPSDDVGHSKGRHDSVRAVGRLDHLRDHLCGEQGLDGAHCAEQHREHEDAARDIGLVELGQVILGVDHEWHGVGVLRGELGHVADGVRARAQGPHEGKLKDGAHHKCEEAGGYEVGEAAGHLGRELHGGPGDEGDEHHPAHL